jgi:hypothetical protein
VVTATLNHYNSHVYELKLQHLGSKNEDGGISSNGEQCQILNQKSSLLNPTDRHPIFSETRQDWVPAAELRAGEQVRTAHGPTTLESIRKVPGMHRVYNMEVETDHCYFAGVAGVLSHNTGVGCNGNTATLGGGSGVGWTTERQRNSNNADWENAGEGAASDIATRGKIVPTLGYRHPNPTPRTKSYVKFDNVDSQGRLIDRKLNVTTKSGQLAQLHRMMHAAAQNPTVKIVIQVPTAAAKKAAEWALAKSAKNNRTTIPTNITVEVSP